MTDLSSSVIINSSSPSACTPAVRRKSPPTPPPCQGPKTKVFGNTGSPTFMMRSITTIPEDSIVTPPPHEEVCNHAPGAKTKVSDNTGSPPLSARSNSMIPPEGWFDKPLRRTVSLKHGLTPEIMGCMFQDCRPGKCIH